MPLDCLSFSENPLLAKLGRVERLLATERQWCKGKLHDGDGRYCLVGAIEATDGWPEVARVILRAVREVSGRRYWRIESFNDDPRTTHADVLAVLRQARKSIIASMADDYDLQPWPRNWLKQTLRGFYRRSGAQTGAPLQIGSESATITGEAQACRAVSRHPSNLLIREHSEMSAG